MLSSENDVQFCTMYSCSCLHTCNLTQKCRELFLGRKKKRERKRNFEAKKDVWLKAAVGTKLHPLHAIAHPPFKKAIHNLLGINGLDELTMTSSVNNELFMSQSVMHCYQAIYILLGVNGLDKLPMTSSVNYKLFMSKSVMHCYQGIHDLLGVIG